MLQKKRADIFMRALLDSHSAVKTVALLFVSSSDLPDKAFLRSMGRIIWGVSPCQKEASAKAIRGVLVLLSPLLKDRGCQVLHADLIFQAVLVLEKK